MTSLWLSAHVHTGDKLKEKPDPPPPLAQQLCYAVGAFCCHAYNLKGKDCANQYKVFLIVLGGVSYRMTGHEGSWNDLIRKSTLCGLFQSSDLNPVKKSLRHQGFARTIFHSYCSISDTHINQHQQTSLTYCVFFSLICHPSIVATFSQYFQPH